MAPKRKQAVHVISSDEDDVAPVARQEGAKEHNDKVECHLKATWRRFLLQNLLSSMLRRLGNDCDTLHLYRKVTIFCHLSGPMSAFCLNHVRQSCSAWIIEWWLLTGCPESNTSEEG